MISRRTILAGIASTLATPAIAIGRRRRLLVVVGQSLSTPWSLQDVQEAFRSTAGDDWDVISAGRGGSAATKRFCGASRPDHWWINGTSPGPCLQRALDLTRGRTIDAMLVNQGQNEGGRYTAGLWGISPDEFRQYYWALPWLRILLIMRRASVGAGWKSIPAFVESVGWRSGPQGTFQCYGDEQVRLAQMEMVAYHSVDANVHLGAIQTPSMTLADSVHRTLEGSCAMAMINGDIIRSKLG